MTSRPIRVLHLIKGLGRGGAETLLAQGLRFADRERFTYGFGYFLPEKDALVASLAAEGADVTCFGARGSAAVLMSARRVAAHARRWRADVLHCHLPLAGVAGRVGGRLAGVPVVYTEHNAMEQYHALTRRLNVWSWRWQDRVVAVSREVAASARAHAGSMVEIEIAPNGVDEEHFRRDASERAEARRRLGFPEGAVVIGTVAVFRAQKRLDVWLRAAQLLHERHPDARFLVVGDGPLHEQVHAAVAALGLSDVVVLPGLSTDVRPLMAAMDVYMMSSDMEGLPVALLEAMAMELPAVVTAVGGIPEVVRPARSGVLVSPGSPEALADAADGLVRDASLRRILGAGARSIVVRDFSIRRLTAQLERVYVEVAGGRQRGS